MFMGHDTSIHKNKKKSAQKCAGFFSAFCVIARVFYYDIPYSMKTIYENPESKKTQLNLESLIMIMVSNVTILFRRKNDEK